MSGAVTPDGAPASVPVTASLLMQNPMVAARVQQYSGAYVATLGDRGLRTAEGSVQLGQVASREAYVLAYNDVFLAVSLIALAAIALLLTHALVKRLGRPDLQADTQAA